MTAYQGWRTWHKPMPYSCRDKGISDLQNGSLIPRTWRHTPCFSEVKAGNAMAPCYYTYQMNIVPYMYEAESECNSACSTSFIGQGCWKGTQEDWDSPSPSDISKHSSFHRLSWSSSVEQTHQEVWNDKWSGIYSTVTRYAANRPMVINAYFHVPLRITSGRGRCHQSCEILNNQRFRGKSMVGGFHHQNYTMSS